MNPTDVLAIAPAIRLPGTLNLTNADPFCCVDVGVVDEVDVDADPAAKVDVGEEGIVG